MNEQELMTVQQVYLEARNRRPHLAPILDQYKEEHETNVCCCEEEEGVVCLYIKLLRACIQEVKRAS